MYARHKKYEITWIFCFAKANFIRFFLFIIVCETKNFTNIELITIYSMLMIVNDKNEFEISNCVVKRDVWIDWFKNYESQNVNLCYDKSWCEWIICLIVLFRKLQNTYENSETNVNFFWSNYLQNSTLILRFACVTCRIHNKCSQKKIAFSQSCYLSKKKCEIHRWEIY